jgi:hypothetical protein
MTLDQRVPSRPCVSDSHERRGVALELGVPRGDLITTYHVVVCDPSSGDESGRNLIVFQTEGHVLTDWYWLNGLVLMRRACGVIYLARLSLSLSKGVALARRFRGLGWIS